MAEPGSLAAAESHLRKVYALLVGSLAQLDRHEEAWRACQEGRRHYPDDAPTHVQLGHALAAAGRTTEATASWQEALRRNPATRTRVNRSITPRRHCGHPMVEDERQPCLSQPTCRAQQLRTASVAAPSARFPAR